MTQSCTVEIAADVSRFTSKLAELLRLVEFADLPPEILDRLADLVDTGEELVRFESDGAPAAGAGHLTVRAQPSNRLLGLVSALRAGDADLGTFERLLGHDLLPADAPALAPVMISLASGLDAFRSLADAVLTDGWERWMIVHDGDGESRVIGVSQILAAAAVALVDRVTAFEPGPGGGSKL